jgi:hypothetical protein
MPGNLANWRGRTLKFSAPRSSPQFNNSMTHIRATKPSAIFYRQPEIGAGLLGAV